MPTPDEKLDWLNEAHDSARLMEMIADDLLRIAEKLGFFMPKSQAIDRLMDHFYTLNAQAKKLRNSVGQKVGEDLRGAQEMSGSLLKACIAGVFMGEKRPTAEATAALQNLAAVTNQGS